MSDAAPAAVPSPAKPAKAKGKKKVAPKKPAVHPKYSEMIAAAIVSLKERSGSSRQAILKYIIANYKVGDNPNVPLKMALKRGVKTGDLKQVKGSGASGSFKVLEKPKPRKKAAAKKPAAKKPKAKKSAAKKDKKPAAKKGKKLAPKKKVVSASAKKPAAKKAKKPAKRSKKVAVPKKRVAIKKK